MADYRNSNRDRSNSIFSDHDHDHRRQGSWRGGREGPSGQGDDRGFFSKAGDEVRSWFGNDEAEQRRETDARRWEREHGETGRYEGGGHEDQWRGGNPDRDSGRQPERSAMRSNMSGGRGQGGGYGQDNYGGGYSRRSSGQGSGFSERSYGEAGHRGFGPGQFGRPQSGQGGYGQSGQSSGQDRGASHHDESYRRWREQQIATLDREYEEYCRHRQEQFDQEFHSFRQTRTNQSRSLSGAQSERAASGGATNVGLTETSSSSGATGWVGSETGQNAGETTTGAGAASAATSSTGSSGPATDADTGKSKSR